MNRWLERIDKNIRTRKLFRDGESILVAVSGGVDSMVLLNSLHILASKHRWKLAVAHFNHQLRGRSSDADKKLVRRTAQGLKLPIQVGSENVKAFANKEGLSIEMGARELRHRFFVNAAKKYKASSIALAHHADDQVELFFLRLLRGAGGEGLGGMNWVSQSPVDRKVRLSRPLLDFAKEELLEIAREERIAFREDATNTQTDFLRNRVRHELLPHLAEIQPGVRNTILRTMELVRADSEFVLAAAQEWLATKPREPFQELAVAVQRLCLRLQVHYLGLPADFDLIEQLRLFPDRAVSVNAEIVLERNAAGTVSKCEKNSDFSAESKTIDLNTTPETQFAGHLISWKIEAVSGKSFQRKKNVEHFDGDKVGTTVVLRHWRPGDRFQPIGMKKPVKLQDLFVNQKVAREQRHRLIVAEANNGQVFWVQGFRISESFKLTANTERRLIWCF